MRKRIVSILLSSTMVLVVFTQFSMGVLAAENQNGGQVVTEGIVTFYEDSTEPSTTEPSTTTEPSSSEPTPSTSSSEPKVTKPVGRVPSLGEIAKGSLIVVGIALVIAALFFFFWKKRKDKEADK